MIPQGCNQGRDSILMSQAAEDTADCHQGVARAGCSREQGEPAAEEDNKAGKDGDTTAKLGPHSPFTCARSAVSWEFRAPYQSVAEGHQHHRVIGWPGHETCSPTKHKCKARLVRPHFSRLFLTELFPPSCLA